MRWLTTLAALTSAVAVSRAAEPAPLVEKYLHSGELAVGDRGLQRALDAAPDDDQLRFGLGVLRFVRAVERLGQSLYEYGAKSESTSVPFLRLPVPENPDPTPITYPILRRIFEQCTDDLARAEATLAGVKDDNVSLPVHFAGVRLDFVGDGTSRTTLVDVLKKLTGQRRFEFLEKNPKFLVRFDRGDVAWLRAYCHLLSALLDAYLALDGKFLFDAEAENHFAKPKGQAANKPDLFAVLLSGGVKFPEPARLYSFRLHMIRVCELNRETWRLIRAETDDDHEWLPNPRQKGVLGLPVRDEMIDGWLRAVDELERLLKGEKLIDVRLPGVAEGMAINVRAFLDDPPAKLDVNKILGQGVDAKYLSKLTGENRYDDGGFNRVMALFGDSMGVAYMAWFN
jgi:hypothetical protein